MNFFKRLKDLIFAIPFGMKAGDEILTTSNVSEDDGSSTHQQIEHQNLWNDLLKGEVTQQVEELRYETFKSEEMSNEYQYIGNGQARKKNGTTKSIENKRKKFTQYNSNQEYGVRESLKLLENEDERLKCDWKKRKIFKAEYKNPIIKFRLENYIYKVKVNLTNDKYETFFYFIDDIYNREIRPLVNFLKKTKKELESLKGNDVATKTYKSKNEICSELSKFRFTTLNPTNDVPNGIDYIFEKPTFESITEEDGYVVLKYSWKEFDGNKLLSERFKSKTGEEKFKNKEKREGYIHRVSIKSEEEKERTIERCDDSINNWLDKNNLEDNL